MNPPRITGNASDGYIIHTNQARDWRLERRLRGHHDRARPSQEEGEFLPELPDDEVPSHSSATVWTLVSYGRPEAERAVPAPSDRTQDAPIPPGKPDGSDDAPPPSQPT